MLILKPEKDMTRLCAILPFEITLLSNSTTQRGPSTTVLLPFEITLLSN